MTTAICIVWGIFAVLFMIAFPIGIAVMAKREWKLEVRRNCREMAQEALNKGDLKSAKKYIDRSKKYRLTGRRHE